MNTHIMIKRGAQSVLHRAPLPRDKADRIGEQIANSLAQPDNFEKATARYNTTDEFEIGERAANEYVKLVLV